MRDGPRKNPFNFGLDLDVGDHSRDVPLGVSRNSLRREKFCRALMSASLLNVSSIIMDRDIFQKKCLGKRFRNQEPQAFIDIDG